MTKKHLQFCIYYMQVGDPQVAYKITYPRAAVKSLKASVSRLMARPDVAEWVNGTEERVHNRMMRKFHNEHYDEFKEKLLTINEKRTVLTKIIKGETKRVRYIKGKYGPQKVEEDLSADTVLRAIDLDTRLENFYNYLTRSDTWRKAQNIYVNTPTLQQQVNILISQTTEKEDKTAVQGDIESPRPGAPKAIGVGVHSHRTDNTSPLSGDLGVYPRGTDNMLPKQNLSPDCSTRPSPPSLTPKKIINKLTTEPVSSLTPKKIINRLTTEPVSSLTPKKIINRLTIEPVSSLTPKKIINRLTTEPVNSLTPKKIINRLTKVNKTATSLHPVDGGRGGEVLPKLWENQL